MILPKIEISLEEKANKTLDEFEYKGLTIREWADKITSSEYQPVKHGRWINVIGEDYVCSNCKAALWARKTNPVSNYKYCWSCGAKMDGDAE